jgi:hypothetical protein
LIRQTAVINLSSSGKRFWWNSGGDVALLLGKGKLSLTGGSGKAGPWRKPWLRWC